MRIVTWNCHASSPEKIAKMLSARPDIAVIPECSKREVDCMKAAGMSAHWVGNLNSKGLGVFAQNGFELSPMVSVPEVLRGAAAFGVSGPTEFTLIAVWTQPPGTYGSYARQLVEAFTINAEWFHPGPAVVAGDFNTTSRGEKPSGPLGHSRVVEVLRERGLESSYHHVANENHGAETRDTYQHQWKLEQGFHIDYVFVPTAWLPKLTQVSVGTQEEWGRISDHYPLTVELCDLDL